MLFPVYPNFQRRLARFMLRARFALLPLFVAGLILFGVGAARNQGTLMAAGTLAGAVGFLYFGTFGARDALAQVEIGEEEICLVDERGEPLRAAEYRYVRKIETRTLYLTYLSTQRRNRGLFEDPLGRETELILAYIDRAHCFEDLKLCPTGWRKAEKYWCNELLYHPYCIAFAYDEEAWRLLQARVAHRDAAPSGAKGACDRLRPPEEAGAK